MNIPLIDLAPQFMRYETRQEPGQFHRPGGKCAGGHTTKCWEERVGPRVYHVPIDSIAGAQGVMFACPLCFTQNGNTIVGTHRVLCWSRSRGVPDDADPGPGRWALVGTGFKDLSLEADPPSKKRSVLLTGGCGWHGYITKGVAS